MATRQTQQKRKHAPTHPETEVQKPRGKHSKDSVFIPFLFHSNSRASSLVAEVTKDEAKLFLPTVLPNFIKAIQLADENNTIASKDYRWAFYTVSQPLIFYFPRCLTLLSPL